MQRDNAEMATVPVERGKSRHGDSVFLVYGRNLGAKDRVARFVERLGVDVVVLDECAGEGRTIIENLELHGDVAYAVVLITGDDVGGLNGAGVEGQLLRARQNVILELGYFLGRLRRSRVCVLYEEGVEIPTDYSGTLWVKFDELGAWRLSLAKELRTAGLRVDLDRIL
jgi:predicted nucleotide-binding protein